MKLPLSVLCMMFSTLVASAETLSLWKELLPGYRKLLAVSSLPDKMFSPKMEAPSAQAPVDNDAAMKEIVDKVAALKVTALVWSDVPADKRVLMGDIVMREGQSIPSYVFNDNKYYVLTEIDKNYLRFKMQDGDLTNPVVFNVPFGLKDNLKNESNFSSAAKDEKK